MQITSGKVVLFDYKLTDADGELVEDTSESGPLAFIQGADQVVAGLQVAMEGRQAGEEFSVIVSPEEGYGLIDEDRILVVPRVDIEEVEKLEIGDVLQARSEDGEEAIVFVTKVGEDTITLSGNHPLAGEELHFQIWIREVRDATAEESEHGHAHGEGGEEH